MCFTFKKFRKCVFNKEKPLIFNKLRREVRHRIKLSEVRSNQFLMNKTEVSCIGNKTNTK